MQNKFKLLGLILASCTALYLSACEGPAGQPGANGRSGVEGEDGKNGLVGDAGIDGEDGEDGVGSTGPGGAKGRDCTVVNNLNGTYTIKCTDGTNVTVSNGANGANGTAGGFAITDFHGEDYLRTSGEFALEVNPKSMVNATVTGAWVTAGTVTATFKVLDGAAKPVTVTSVSVNIAKLVANPVSTQWVNYLYGKAATANATTDCVTYPLICAGAAEWNLAPFGPLGLGVTAGTQTIVASSESSGTLSTNGTLTNLGNGNHKYVFKKKIDAVTVDGVAVTYDATATHRISVMTGGHSGPTATATYDFVPAGGALPLTRDIVRTDVCYACHSKLEFHGHGGNRLTVENCVSCHNPGLTPKINRDAQSLESMDMKVMIHKIHGGGEVASIPGADGKVFDDPATTDDESADNGHFVFWGNRFSRNDWSGAGFPAIAANCQKCHQQPAGATPVLDVNNWQTKMSRAACGSCHDNVDFSTGLGHPAPGGQQLNDTNCAVCHGSGIGGQNLGAWPVAAEHDWTTKDARKVTEFNIAVTISTPTNGTHFVAGEKPKVYIKLTDKSSGLPVDVSNFQEDLAPEGCLATGCPAGDGKYAPAYLFVSGPRGDRNPVLGTVARAQVKSPLAATATVNLSAAAATLVLKVDQGRDLMLDDVSGGDVLRPAKITVKVADGYKKTVTWPNGIWSNGATNATLPEIAAWLNADANFAARAIAAVESGKLSVRSRNLGKVYSIQLDTSAVATAVFGGNTALVIPGGYYAYNKIDQHTDVSKNDPKVTWTSSAIIYELDPVNDLRPGTYVATAYLSDRGAKVRGVDFRATSIGVGTFNVKQASTERPPANNCDSCHQASDGKGLVMHDFAALGANAVDTCGSCHDYQPAGVVGTAFAGAHPISKRVHAVHNGANLTYPNTTVAHTDGIPGRNWDIVFPQSVQRCEACHDSATSSGTWATDPNRLACMGCHDKDAATAHVKDMTYDPTPFDSWSGDEEEACAVCH